MTAKPHLFCAGLLVGILATVPLAAFAQPSAPARDHRSAASPSGSGTAPILARVIVEGGGGHRGSPNRVQARLDEPVSLAIELRRGRRWRRLGAAEGTVRWLRVRPQMQHVAMPPANDGIAQYSNSVLFGPSHGRWIGYDTVEYVNEDLVSGSVAAIDGQRLVLSGVPDHGDGPASGTLWIAAEVTLTNGDRLRTPDAAAVDRLGLTPAVARVSFRDDDSTLGWLSTYFHVPNVFGSTGVQVDRYVGADCADVLVGARRAAGRRLAYTSASALATTAAPVTPPLFLGPDGKVRDEDGRPVVMRWGEDVEPGDFLVIDYTRAGADLPRAWDHIGALVGDDPASREGRGILDGADLLRHMSPRGLVDQPLRVQGEIRLRVVRL